MYSSIERILPQTKAIAKKYVADLAIPNCEGSGIGNALVYTRLVEDFSRFKGKPLKIFTGPLNPSVGKVSYEDDFALWRNNPFVSDIVNGQFVNSEDLNTVNKERKTLIQLNHIIENICWAYGIRPRELRSSLFLSIDEMAWAFNVLKNIPRPSQVRDFEVPQFHYN